jgi:hypothetical protein
MHIVNRFTFSKVISFFFDAFFVNYIIMWKSYIIALEAHLSLYRYIPTKVGFNWSRIFGEKKIKMWKVNRWCWRRRQMQSDDNTSHDPLEQVSSKVHNISKQNKIKYTWKWNIVFYYVPLLTKYLVQIAVTRTINLVINQLTK